MIYIIDGRKYTEDDSLTDEQLMQLIESGQKLGQENGEDIENDVDFKNNILRSSTHPLMPFLFTKDVFLGNLDQIEKQQVQRLIDFVIKLKTYKLTKASLFFQREVFAILHPTRSYKGFQQEEFNRQRVMQDVNIQEDKRSTGRLFNIGKKQERRQ